MKMSSLKHGGSKASERRKTVIEQRRAQLERGTKPYKEGRDIPEKDEEGKIKPVVKLTQKDVERINKEIEVLSTRII